MKTSPKNITSEIKICHVAKGISILAVIFLHILSTFFDTNIYTSDKTGIFFITINQICRFCVPLFLALSGFGLSRKYQNQSLRTLKYLKKQLIKLTPPYLLWSLILIITFSLSDTLYTNNLNLWPRILYGKADYHLYYVPLLFQFYLLFLFFPKIKHFWHHLSLLSVSIIFQLIWFSLIRISSTQDLGLNKFLQNDQNQYRLLINWIFYFLLGTFIARLDFSYIYPKKYIKYLIIFLIFGGLFWQVFDSYWLIRTTGNIVFATTFTRIPVFIYSTGIISAILIYGHHLIKYVRIYQPFLSYIGKHSYTIYLSHTILLRIIEKLASGQINSSSLALNTLFLVTGLSLTRFFHIS